LRVQSQPTRIVSFVLAYARNEVRARSRRARSRCSASPTAARHSASKLDAILTDEERAHPGLRLIAANRILKEQRPDLWAAAQEE
jgi:hypothetical protein